MRGGTAVAGFRGGRFRLLLARFQAAHRNSTCKYVDQVNGLTTLISEIEVEIGETTTLISKFQKL